MSTNRTLAETSLPRSVSISDGALIKKAACKAGEVLGLTRIELAQVIGVRREVLSRPKAGLDAKQSELALMVIRVARSLSALVDGSHANMRHWISTANQHLGGQAPRDLIKTVNGLAQTLFYLDAMRGKL